MSVITEQEFQDWQEHPVTKRLKKQIAKDIEFMKDLLVDIDFEDLKHLQGRIQASTKLLEIEYGDLYEQPRN